MSKCFSICPKSTRTSLLLRTRDVYLEKAERDRNTDQDYGCDRCLYEQECTVIKSGIYPDVLVFRCVVCPEDNTREKMRDKADNKAEEYCDADAPERDEIQALERILDLDALLVGCGEDTGKADRRKSNDIVEHDLREADEGSADQLKKAEAESYAETSLQAEAEAEENDRQHGSRCDRSALGHLEELDLGEHEAQCEAEAAAGNAHDHFAALDRLVLFLKFGGFFLFIL